MLACLLVLSSLLASSDPSAAASRSRPRVGWGRGVRPTQQHTLTPRGRGNPRRNRGGATDARLLAILWAPRPAPAAQLGPAARAVGSSTASDRERLANSLQDEIAPPETSPLSVEGTLPPLVWPITGPINSPFGPRHRRFHAGIDIGAARDEPVRAAAEGLILYAGNSHGPMGTAIILQHAGGLQTIYAHLAHLHVREGAFVHQGDLIGTVGCTGHTTGPHLHFGVRVDGTTVNPQAYLPPPDTPSTLPLPTDASMQDVGTQDPG